MIKAVIFDCFGVLIGTGYWNVYKRVGGERPQDKPFIDDLLDRSNLNLVDSETLHRETAKKLGVSLPEWESAVLKDELPNPELFTYIKEKLKEDYKLAVLSNAGTGTLERKIPKEYLDMFNVKVTSGEVGLVKPDPNIYRLAAQMLGVRPDECIFIDDHHKYVKGAEDVGMEAILFKDSAQAIADIASLLG